MSLAQSLFPWIVNWAANYSPTPSSGESYSEGVTADPTTGNIWSTGSFQETLQIGGLPPLVCNGTVSRCSLA